MYSVDALTSVEKGESSQRESRTGRQCGPVGLHAKQSEWDDVGLGVGESAASDTRLP